MTKGEAETIINFSAADSMANIYTTDSVWMRKLEKMGGVKNGVGVELDIPKSWIKIIKPRVASEKMKKALAEARKKSPIFNSK